MNSEYRILLSGGSGEIVEKKSRFIANVRAVETEEEAVRFLEEMKKKYWDARHNCSAYIIGNRNPVMRYNDDGEPGGTAGKPILEVLTGSGICNIALVVTRYFGGVLLGTGGLVRAYTRAAQEGLAACRCGIKKPGVRMTVTTDYNAIGKILYLLEQESIEPEAGNYGVDVSLALILPAADKERILKSITELTAGKAQIDEVESVMYTEELPSVTDEK